MRNFVAIGKSDVILVQALQAIHAYSDARCIAICSEEVRFLHSSNLLERYIQVQFDGSDDEYVITEINALARQMPDLIIIPSDCDAERMVDRIHPRLLAHSIPSPNAAMLDCFDNKWNFYKFCSTHGLAVPAAHLIESKYALNFNEVVQDIGLPFIVKPLNQQASIGVQIISSEEEFRQKILDNSDYQYFPLLAQRCIRGIDIGLNFLSIQGKVKAIAVQQRDLPQLPGAKIRFLPHPYLEQVAAIIAEKSNYNGVMNVDARVEENTGKVFLLESNPRFWRSLSAAVWCGLNFVEACIEASDQNDEIRILNSGSADTYYHPLIRPAVLWHTLYSPHSHKRRMARILLCNLWTFSTQAYGMLWQFRKHISKELGTISHTFSKS